MAEKLSELIETLQQANVQFRRQLELADAQIPTLNQSLGQLTNLGFGVSCVVLGDIILSTCPKNGFAIR